MECGSKSCDESLRGVLARYNLSVTDRKWRSVVHRVGVFVAVH